MNKAFTLVELAIVIVIIGLLVGGVLQGKELITQAKIRSQIKQLQEYDTALVTFKGKYNAIPGDILGSKAAQFGLTYVASGYPYCNDGDGILRDYQNNFPIRSVWCEPLNFFSNLSEAKLLKATFTRIGNQYAVGLQFPTTKLGDGGFAYSTMPDGSIYAFLGLNRKDDSTSANLHFLSDMSAQPIFNAEESSSIDEKLDDGNPLKGKVQAVTYLLAPDTTSNSCITNTTSQQYNITDTALRCRLVVRTSL